MAKKFYAVAIGRNPGIYTKTTQMEAQTRGYPNQLSKGFNDEAQAKNWIKQHQVNINELPITGVTTPVNTTKQIEVTNIEPISVPTASISAPSSVNAVTIYTDGSYSKQMDPTRITISYISMMTGDFAEKALISNAHKTITAEEQPYASTIAEIEAALTAIKDAITHGYNVITIRHDCSNIPDLLTSVNNFKDNPLIMETYRETFTKYLTRAAIRFEKVTGHDNDVYNNMVHNLTQL